MGQPKKANARLLEHVAVHYLSRFAASSASLRRVLLRRVERSARVHSTDLDEGAAMVEALVARMVAAGLVDDHAFATARAVSLHRRGTSRRAIAAKLRDKGVAPELIAVALDSLVNELGGAEDLAAGRCIAAADLDWTAAVNLARRRRLGPFRAGAERAAHHGKDMAALARAGFNYAIATHLLAATTPEDLEVENEKADDKG